VAKTREVFRKYDVLALAIPAVMPPPMPFKIFVLCSGVFGISFQRFALTILAARGLRYLIWAFIGVRYGDHALAVLQDVDAWFALRMPWLLSFAAAATALWILAWMAQKRRREAA
jgi:uncharacterized membrane protein YdjX (TVP38/TMEM64 family)